MANVWRCRKVTKGGLAAPKMPHRQVQLSLTESAPATLPGPGAWQRKRGSDARRS